MKKLLLIFIIIAGCMRSTSTLDVSHVLRPNGLEEIHATLSSKRPGTVRFTFFCEPSDSSIEYHEISLKKGKAQTTSGIYCPEFVVIKAETQRDTVVDTLDVGTIRKINQVSQ